MLALSFGLAVSCEVARGRHPEGGKSTRKSSKKQLDIAREMDTMNEPELLAVFGISREE